MTQNTKRINCVNDKCGTFTMDKALYKRYKKTGDTFYCPAGHGQHFTESTEQKLREKIKVLQDRVDRLDDYSNTLWEDLQAEKDQRRALEKRYLDSQHGVVEVNDEAWMWACNCGGRGSKRFESESEARRAYGSHRDEYCGLNPAGVEV